MKRAGKRHPGILSDAQLKAEFSKCEYCEEKPCREACPTGCSPADFIMAARGGTPADYRRSAEMILGANPFGAVCGIVCPDSFCVKACVYRKFNSPVAIPPVQATIIEKARLSGPVEFQKAESNGKRVAIVGGGPAGLSAAAVLARRGYAVTVFEKKKRSGGMSRLIPRFRLSEKIIDADLGFIRSMGDIRFKYGASVDAPEQLLKNGYCAVLIATGQDVAVGLSIPGGAQAVTWEEFLDPKKIMRLTGKSVAVIGGGAVAVDCATTAKRRRAGHVELIYRRKSGNMPLTRYERELLLEDEIEVTTCAKPLAIVVKNNRVRGLRLVHLSLPPGSVPRPENFRTRGAEKPYFRAFDLVVAAIGSRPASAQIKIRGLFYAGDMTGASATVVEAVASGKDAADRLDRYLRGERTKPAPKRAKSDILLSGANQIPVPLSADFFGRKILSPILLSAAPHTDGYREMRAAYERGWAGGVMKTAFDNVPIHIPSEYMFVLGQTTYGNCDNVSGHSLDRVCREIGRLVKEYPDRLTLGSTGGPVTGNDASDRTTWQANTRKLERAGAMGVEYSFSCPQGGDGTKGDMVSQNAELTAKIVDWILEAADGAVPKLFKLSGAVTAIEPIVNGIGEVLKKYPGKKAGVTLANSFPSLSFRTIENSRREEGVVIGMSGDGVLPITNLILAKVSGLGVPVSANGGVMDYRSAARFLALGARTVQCCTIVMKHGLGIIDELHSGLSYLMQEKGFRSVGELIGSALPDPVRPFERLPATKTIPDVTPELCYHCGNCARCPYQAIVMNDRIVPLFDAALCVGCSLCAQKCFSGAIAMRPRTKIERDAFHED